MLSVESTRKALARRVTSRKMQGRVCTSADGGPCSKLQQAGCHDTCTQGEHGSAWLRAAGRATSI